MARYRATLDSILTRFRAYQLGSPGSSFSYFAGGHFTLLEARLTELSRRSLVHEMQLCGVEAADTLHITSWDSDHCSSTELEELLELARPAKIESPGYEPQSDNGGKCQRMVLAHIAAKRSSNRTVKLQPITPYYIDSLDGAKDLAFRDVFFNPRWIDEECANDNSTVKLFRRGSFNVVSLGDVESNDISGRLRRNSQLKNETDVMILAHHGADNGFTTKPFLARLNPSIAVCSSDYDNTYDHPRDEIREMLHERGIRLMTTKTGDIIIKSIGDHSGQFRAINLKADSTEISSQCDFHSKKARLLSFNADTIRQHFAPRPSYPRR